MVSLKMLCSKLSCFKAANLSQWLRLADAPGGKAGDQSDLEKRLRGLRKKLRQVDSLQEKQAAGQLLTPEEHEKLKHAQQWWVHCFMSHICHQRLYPTKGLLGI